MSEIPEFEPYVGEACIIDNPVRITSDYEFPEVPVFFRPGAYLDMAPGVDIKIKSPLIATNDYIFRGDGRVHLYEAPISEIFPQWWGASGRSGVDCSSSFRLMLDALTPQANWGYGGKITIAPGKYHFMRNLVLDRQVVMAGPSGGGWYPSAEFAFGPGAGLIIEKYNPGVSGVGSGDYSTLLYLTLSGTKDPEALSSGITVRAPVKLEGLAVKFFGEHGIYFDATDRVNGFANPAKSYVEGCLLEDNGITDNNNIVTGEVIQHGDGVFIDGEASEGTAILMTNCAATRNTGWGFRDWGNYGNINIGLVTHINRTGPYTNKGGMSTTYNTTSYIGCYSEGDQTPSIFENAIVIGGHHGAGIQGTGHFIGMAQMDNHFDNQMTIGVGNRGNLDRRAMLTVHGGYGGMTYARDFDLITAALLRVYPDRDLPVAGVVGHGMGNGANRHGIGAYLCGEQESPHDGKAYGFIAEALSGKERWGGWFKTDNIRILDDVALVVVDGRLAIKDLKSGEVRKIALEN